MNRALCMIAGGLLYSCASTAAGDASAADIPSWWEDPHKHDQSHLYFKAKGESFLSLEDARAEAFKSIKKQVAEYIQSSIEVRDRRIDVASRFELREVESFREFEPPHRTDQWIVFVLGRYPRTEYERIRGRLEQADRLVKEWAVAQSNVNREEFAQAESRLLGIISQYDLSLSPGFTLEDAKLALAGLYLKQGSVLKARTWIQDVRKSTTEPGWRSRAEDMERNLPEISLNDAFGSRKVALFCCASAGRDFRNSPEMQTEASAQLARAGVQAAMLTFQEPVATQIFNNGNADALLAKARDAGADVVLAMMLNIDSSKTGKAVKIPGDGVTSALDATVNYNVILVPSGRALCSDEVRGFSGGSASTAARNLLGIIFNHHGHLRRHAAAIAQAFEDEK